MRVIPRDELESVSDVEVDGQRHQLGLLKDFHRHEYLAKFVPEQARLSMSWVHLAPGQELEAHRHPTKSMILVTEGSGRVNGDLDQPITTGDVVAVPPGDLHGFVGNEPAGFWGLSVQFEGDGLYEDLSSPRVRFAATATLDAVVAANDAHMERWRNNPLVALARECAAESNQPLRQRLADELQPWSDEFQRLITQRVAAETDDSLRPLAHEHLVEEVGHNLLLAKSRPQGAAVGWDPVVSAAASWFLDRMTHGSSVERTVLVHLVLEGSGMIFHGAGAAAFPDSDYFNLHSEGDVEHLEMGYRALAERHDWSLPAVLDMLDRGWQMMTLLGDRLAERATR